MVNRVKGRDGRSDDNDDDGGFETAICLLTGAVMRSGTIRRMKEVSASLSYPERNSACRLMWSLSQLLLHLPSRFGLPVRVLSMRGKLDLD
jgi:hypothetical protein